MTLSEITVCQVHLKLQGGYLSAFNHSIDNIGDNNELSFYGAGYEIGTQVKYKSENNFFAPFFEYSMRNQGANAEYSIGSSNFSFTSKKTYRFFSHNISLGNTFTINKFDLSLAAGFSLYSWWSIISSGQMQASKPTGYRFTNYTLSDKLSEENDYYIFVSPAVSYSYSRRLSFYSTLTMPVHWNSDFAIFNKGELADNWNNYEYYSETRFKAFLLTVGLRYTIWKS